MLRRLLLLLTTSYVFAHPLGGSQNHPQTPQNDATHAQQQNQQPQQTQPQAVQYQQAQPQVQYQQQQQIAPNLFGNAYAAPFLNHGFSAAPVFGGAYNSFPAFTSQPVQDQTVSGGTSYEDLYQQWLGTEQRQTLSPFSTLGGGIFGQAVAGGAQQQIGQAAGQQQQQVTAAQQQQAQQQIVGGAAQQQQVVQPGAFAGSQMPFLRPVSYMQMPPVQQWFPQYLQQPYDGNTYFTNQFIGGNRQQRQPLVFEPPKQQQENNIVPVRQQQQLQFPSPSYDIFNLPLSGFSSDFATTHPNSQGGLVFTQDQLRQMQQLQSQTSQSAGARTQNIDASRIQNTQPDPNADTAAPQVEQHQQYNIHNPLATFGGLQFPSLGYTAPPVAPQQPQQRQQQQIQQQQQPIFYNSINGYVPAQTSMYGDGAYWTVNLQSPRVDQHYGLESMIRTLQPMPIQYGQQQHHQQLQQQRPQQQAPPQFANGYARAFVNVLSPSPSQLLNAGSGQQGGGPDISLPAIFASNQAGGAGNQEQPLPLNTEPTPANPNAEQQ